MGRVDSAAACGDLLVKMIDDQPNKNKFYLKRDLNGEIIVDLMDRQLKTHVIEFAKTQAKERAFLQAQESGAIDIEVYTTENYISVTPDDLSENIFFECLITGIATGRPCLA